MTTTSSRLLTLLSLLQSRRDWPGGLLAQRLEVAERTVRRDIDRLRELGYPIAATRGPDGGYRLQAGSRMPPLLFDDDQVIALTVALQLATTPDNGIDEASARALGTIRQVLPERLRGRIDAMGVRAVRPRSAQSDPPVTPELLAEVSAAVHAHDVLRFSYAGPGPDEQAPPRRVEPHHLIAWSGRWYLLGWDLDRNDWRTYRLDRMTLRFTPGPRFRPREIPGGDVDAFVVGRFRGNAAGPEWPCQGSAVLAVAAAEVLPYVRDGDVEDLGDGRCRIRLGAWSWPGLAARFGSMDADINDAEPAELRAAFALQAERLAAAATR